ncbi:Chitin elicitor-binding protein [Triticum urartu]|uniref:Chitin elicitor-binding protein n=1 Tax=Triticum urartu TaxID=4572 RepID=M7ZKV6_TRIUA|nr:Chitin elicitor-binding protein [Triticum urartu]
MPPLAALLLLLWAAASSASAASFTCAKPSTCRSAVAYVVPNATTYEQLASRFSPTATLHHLLAANQLPPHTDTSQAIPAKTAVRIPFRCRCAGGLGQSDLDMYTGGRGDDYFMEVVTANNVAAGKYYGRRPLPCSCDKVDGSHVMHLAYVIVRAGDNISQIAAKYGLRESTLLRINNITSSQLLIRQGHILDIPLFQGMGTWSRVHYNSAHRKRRLQGGDFNWTKTLPVSKVWNILKDIGEESSVFNRCSISLMLTMLKFHIDALLGEGMFGAVYKATFKGQEVAVKRIKAEGKLEEFHRELQTVGNTTHENLVDLKGWCGKVRVIDGKTWWKRVIKVELFLVFEFISNGDLEHHLHNNDQVLSWDKRETNSFMSLVLGYIDGVTYCHIDTWNVIIEYFTFTTEKLICRVLFKWHSTKEIFAKCFLTNNSKKKMDYHV